MQANTTGDAASLRFTTMRADAHITSAGDLFRMPQQDVVISGTVSYTHLTLPTKRIV